MTAAHLLFAVVTTLYIFFAIQLEEKDLVREHGSKYVNYRNNVPMIIPFSSKKDNVSKPVPQE
jgi:methanethiol S-methyltransferase